LFAVALLSAINRAGLARRQASARQAVPKGEVADVNGGVTAGRRCSSHAPHR
jgi:hypothetical protein